jgi:integrase
LSAVPATLGRLFPGRYSKAAAIQMGRTVSDTNDRFDWSRPIDEQNVYKRFWLPALDALQLPHSRWHDLRHSAAVSTLATEHIETYPDG